MKRCLNDLPREQWLPILEAMRRGDDAEVARLCAVAGIERDDEPVPLAAVPRGVWFNADGSETAQPKSASCGRASDLPAGG